MIASNETIFYMFTRCILCMENQLKPWRKTVNTMEIKSTMEKSMRTMNRRKPLKNRLHTMEKSTKPMEKQII